MKSYTAHIKVMPHPGLLDPQGKTVANNMKHLHIDGVQDVRIGKHILMSVEADNDRTAEDIVKAACDKLLANPIMEFYEYEIKATQA